MEEELKAVPVIERSTLESPSIPSTPDGKHDIAPLKHSNGVVLIPQPSDDPRDPLVSS